MCYILTHMQETVGVRELRQNLSKYLERVKAGENLVVTERGREVARLVPSGDGPYAEMARELGATIPTRDLIEVIDSLPPRDPAPAGTTDRILDELRRRDDPR